MSGRHRKRPAELGPTYIRMVEGGAKTLMSATQRACGEVSPYSEHYAALMKLDDEIRIALNIINGRPADQRASGVTPGFMADLEKHR